MRSSWMILLLMLYLSPMIAMSSINETYNEERRKILNEEINQRLGSQLTLNKKENIVNTYLMKLKEEEMKLYREGPQLYPSSMLFTDAKKQIEQSKVFQLLQKMPKGGLLHIHYSAAASVEWVVGYITYLPCCYICWNQKLNLVLKFLFSGTKPLKRKDCIWELVARARSNYAKGAQAFNKMLVNAIVWDGKQVYSNQTAIWDRFEEYFSLVANLIRYKPVFKIYIYRALIELWRDNIQHIEIRSSLSPTYQLDGSLSSTNIVINQYISAIDFFKMRHCKDCTVRLIVTCNRNKPNSVIVQKLYETQDLIRRYPNFVVGFDLIGREDKGKTLFSLSHILKSGNVSYFFHAGETNQQGTAIDENLVDAILLGTKRLGHAYALLKHTKLLKLVKERNIAIEVCPISNQVLGLVHDLRNHPATYLIANNFPVVISSDDPAVWEASGLSHDFYLTFMGMVDMEADIRVLKQLAINSIKLSSLSTADQAIALAGLEKRWNNFISNTIYHLTYSGKDVRTTIQQKSRKNN